MPPYTQVGKYILKKRIGEGAFAEVRLAVHEDTREEFAVKVFDRANLPKSHFERDIKKEIKIMQHLRHPNIVEIYAVLVTDKKLYLVMELVRGGELYDEIVSKRRVDEATSRRYFQQIVDAMVYCHRRGVVHRDLKPENLLLDGTGNVKITDFGMSWMLDNVDPALKAKQLLRTQCGTPKYMPPEIILRPVKGYDGEKLDAWECGMVLYALLAGYLPFSGEDDNSVFKSILNGQVRFPKHFSPGAKDLLSRLLEKDPEERSTLEEIREHFWFLVSYHGDAVNERRKVLKQAGLGPLEPMESHNKNNNDADKENLDPMTGISSGTPTTPRLTNQTSCHGRPGTPKAINSATLPPTAPAQLRTSGIVAPPASIKESGGGMTDASLQEVVCHSSSAMRTTPKALPKGPQAARASGEARALRPAARKAPPLSMKLSSNNGELAGDDCSPSASPMSFRNRLRSPLTVFKSLRSGNVGGSDAKDGTAGRETGEPEADETQGTWFEPSPTSVAGAAKIPPLVLRNKGSRFSNSMSSSENDEMVPADDYTARDGTVTPSAFRKMAKVFQKKA